MSLLRRWKARRARRHAEIDARDARIREVGVREVERLVRAVVEAGAATMSKDEYDTIRLVPTNPRAAQLLVSPGLHWYDIGVGPHLNNHEALISRDEEWNSDIEACIVAVLEGRYVEEVNDKANDLTMTFGIPDREDIVVIRRAGSTPADGSPMYGKPGVHTYEPYL